MKEIDEFHPNAMEFEIKEEHYVEINGAQIYYEYENVHSDRMNNNAARDSPDRWPILLVHGWSANRFRLHPIYLHFMQIGWPVFRIDLRGHGWSEKRTKWDYTIANHIADIDKFIRKVIIEQFGYEKVILIGHSMGGIIGQGLAIQQPTYLAKLILLATGPFFTDNIFKKLMGWLFIWIWKHNNDYMMRKKLGSHQFLGIEHFPQWSNRYNTKGRTLMPDPKANWQEMASMMRIDWRPGLPKINVPCLIVAAANDDLAKPEIINALRNGISGSILEIIPDCMHNLAIHKPLSVVKIIDRFLEKSQ